MSTWVILFFLLVGGLLMLLVEFLLIPGFGVAGVVGLVAIAISIGFALYSAFIVQTVAVSSALAFVFSSIIASVALVVLAVRILPRTSFGRRLILDSSFKSEEGYVGSNENLDSLAGASGTTLTALRPAGTAEIKGYRVDVVSEGEFVPEQTEIKVIKVEGNRVVVVRSETAASESGGQNTTDENGVEGERVS